MMSQAIILQLYSYLVSLLLSYSIHFISQKQFYPVFIWISTPSFTKQSERSLGRSL